MSVKEKYIAALNDEQVNPAKRNVLDLKNETCKNREKRNVLKISHTRPFKTTKKQSKMGCFYSFERQTNSVQMRFKLCGIRLHEHHIFITSIKVHMRIELETLTTFERIAERFILA